MNNITCFIGLKNNFSFFFFHIDPSRKLLKEGALPILNLLPANNANRSLVAASGRRKLSASTATSPTTGNPSGSPKGSKGQQQNGALDSNAINYTVSTSSKDNSDPSSTSSTEVRTESPKLWTKRVDVENHDDGQQIIKIIKRKYHNDRKSLKNLVQQTTQNSRKTLVEYNSKKRRANGDSHEHDEHAVISPLSPPMQDMHHRRKAGAISPISANSSLTPSSPSSTEGSGSSTNVTRFVGNHRNHVTTVARPSNSPPLSSSQMRSPSAHCTTGFVDRSMSTITIPLTSSNKTIADAQKFKVVSQQQGLVPGLVRHHSSTNPLKSSPLPPRSPIRSSSANSSMTSTLLNINKPLQQQHGQRQRLYHSRSVPPPLVSSPSSSSTPRHITSSFPSTSNGDHSSRTRASSIMKNIVLLEDDEDELDKKDSTLTLSKHHDHYHDLKQQQQQQHQDDSSTIRSDDDQKDSLLRKQLLLESPPSSPNSSTRNMCKLQDFSSLRSEQYSVLKRGNIHDNTTRSGYDQKDSMLRENIYGDTKSNTKIREEFFTNNKQYLPFERENHHHHQSPPPPSSSSNIYLNEEPHRFDVDEQHTLQRRHSLPDNSRSRGGDYRKDYSNMLMTLDEKEHNLQRPQSLPVIDRRHARDYRMNGYIKRSPPSSLSMSLSEKELTLQSQNLSENHGHQDYGLDDEDNDTFASGDLILPRQQQQQQQQNRYYQSPLSPTELRRQNHSRQNDDHKFSLSPIELRRQYSRQIASSRLRQQNEEKHVIYSQIINSKTMANENIGIRTARNILPPPRPSYFVDKSVQIQHSRGGGSHPEMKQNHIRTSSRRHTSNGGEIIFGEEIEMESIQKYYTSPELLYDAGRSRESRVYIEHRQHPYYQKIRTVPSSPSPSKNPANGLLLHKNPDYHRKNNNVIPHQQLDYGDVNSRRDHHVILRQSRENSARTNFRQRQQQQENENTVYQKHRQEPTTYSRRQREPYIIVGEDVETMNNDDFSSTEMIRGGGSAHNYQLYRNTSSSPSIMEDIIEDKGTAHVEEDAPIMPTLENLDDGRGDKSVDPTRKEPSAVSSPTTPSIDQIFYIDTPRHEDQQTIHVTESPEDPKMITMESAEVIDENIDRKNVGERKESFPERFVNQQDMAVEEIPFPDHFIDVTTIDSTTSRPDRPNVLLPKESYSSSDTNVFPKEFPRAENGALDTNKTISTIAVLLSKESPSETISTKNLSPPVENNSRNNENNISKPSKSSPVYQYENW